MRMADIIRGRARRGQRGYDSSTQEDAMTIAELFAGQLDRESAISSRVLARVPEGRADWKPHDKSMALGYLATLVATIPAWVAMMIGQDSLDLNPPGGGAGYEPPSTATRREL